MSSGKSLSRFGILALLAGALSISLSPIFVRLSELGPSATAFHRLFLSLPVLWLWLWIDSGRKRDLPKVPLRARDYRILALAGFFFACDLGAWHWSIQLTSIANSTLLANTAPLFVAIGGYLLFGEKITSRIILGTVFAFIGLVLMVGVSFGTSVQHFIGDALGVLTAVFYASYMLALSRLRRSLSTVTIMCGSGLVTCLLLLPLALLSGESLIPPSLYGWGLLLGLALISHAGGQSLITFAFAFLPASFCSLGLLLQPAAAAVLGWLILGEHLTLLQGAGGLFILAGIAIARRSSAVSAAERKG
ncbi:MAG: DMT family transporter [Opitutales bacterium]